MIKAMHFMGVARGVITPMGWRGHVDLDQGRSWCCKDWGGTTQKWLILLAFLMNKRPAGTPVRMPSCFSRGDALSQVMAGWFGFASLVKMTEGVCLSKADLFLGLLVNVDRGYDRYSVFVN
jgi:hypothetical protein